MNANDIVKQAVEQLDALAQQALAAGHTGLAAFLHKRSSETYYGAPTLDGALPDHEHAEWVPDAAGNCATLPCAHPAPELDVASFRHQRNHDAGDAVRAALGVA